MKFNINVAIVMLLAIAIIGVIFMGYIYIQDGGKCLSNPAIYAASYLEKNKGVICYCTINDVSNTGEVFKPSKTIVFGSNNTQY